jgi:hypothetical protein
VGWLERWDKRNQRIADELMRNPDAGLDTSPKVGLAVLASWDCRGSWSPASPTCGAGGAVAVEQIAIPTPRC